MTAALYSWQLSGRTEHVISLVTFAGNASEEKTAQKFLSSLQVEKSWQEHRKKAVTVRIFEFLVLDTYSTYVMNLIGSHCRILFNCSRLNFHCNENS